MYSGEVCVPPCFLVLGMKTHKCGLLSAPCCKLDICLWNAPPAGPGTGLAKRSVATYICTRRHPDSLLTGHLFLGLPSSVSVSFQAREYGPHLERVREITKEAFLTPEIHVSFITILS